MPKKTRVIWLPTPGLSAPALCRLRLRRTRLEKSAEVQCGERLGQAGGGTLKASWMASARWRAERPWLAKSVRGN